MSPRRRPIRRKPYPTDKTDLYITIGLIIVSYLSVYGLGQIHETINRKPPEPIRLIVDWTGPRKRKAEEKIID